MLKTVANFLNPLEAHIALGRLKAEGIDAHILHEHHVWANWMYSQALGGVKIQVAEPDVDAAYVILKQYHQGEFAQDLPADSNLEPPEEIHCPACYSRNYQRYHSMGQLVGMVLSLGLLNLLIPLSKSQFRCQTCQTIWRSQ